MLGRCHGRAIAACCGVRHGFGVGHFATDALGSSTLCTYSDCCNWTAAEQLLVTLVSRPDSLRTTTFMWSVMQIKDSESEVIEC